MSLYPSVELLGVGDHNGGEDTLIFTPERFLGPVKCGFYCDFANGRGLLIPETNLVRVKGEWKEIPPRPFDLLTVLAMRAGKLVTYETIDVELWDGLTDYETTAATRIMSDVLPRLRSNLGPELGNSKTGAIKTINRCGLILAA